ncbi:hypothetical protein E2C01_080295 [Portunus trituberculatus]|uniref:Uncharacterized protein n=1 Tax=Portunus trituberculatus TaxID=210409 RepID=A0A5B7IV18_PORTR|nr:hypothetical protein [Portunus trituberculatus]
MEKEKILVVSIFFRPSAQRCVEMGLPSHPAFIIPASQNRSDLTHSASKGEGTAHTPRLLALGGGEAQHCLPRVAAIKVLKTEKFFNVLPEAIACAAISERRGARRGAERRELAKAWDQQRIVDEGSCSG